MQSRPGIDIHVGHKRRIGLVGRNSGISLLDLDMSQLGCVIVISPHVGRRERTRSKPCKSVMRSLLAVRRIAFWPLAKLCKKAHLCRPGGLTVMMGIKYSCGFVAPHRPCLGARERIKAHVTIETAERPYTDGSKKIAFNRAAAMRTRGLDAFAVRAVACRVHFD
jgi:hypothetical protein